MKIYNHRTDLKYKFEWLKSCDERFKEDVIKRFIDNGYRVVIDHQSDFDIYDTLTISWVKN